MGKRNGSTETLSQNLLGDSQQVEFDFPSQRHTSKSAEERNDHMVSSDDDESESESKVIEKLSIKSNSQNISNGTEPFVTFNLSNLDIQNEVEVECHEENLEESDNEVIRPVGKHTRKLSSTFDSQLPSPLLSTSIVSENIQPICTLDQAITDFVRPLVPSQKVSDESQNVEAMETTSSPIIKDETHTQYSQNLDSVIFIPNILEIIEIDDSQNNDVRDLLRLENSDSFSQGISSKSIHKAGKNEKETPVSMPQAEIRMPVVSISDNMESLQIKDNISFNPPQSSTQVSK